MARNSLLGILRPDWYREVVVGAATFDLPGLYEWRIDGVGCYIGQFTRARRPRREYGLNVARILTGRPYRKGKPDRFRLIHRQLADAVRENRAITLLLLENESDRIRRNQREQELIALRRVEAEVCGLPVLNAT